MIQIYLECKLDFWIIIYIYLYKDIILGKIVLIKIIYM